MEKISSFRFQGIFNMIFPINELQFLENPVIRALIDCNILYYEKYKPYLRVQKRLYVFFVREWVKKKKAEMSLKERMAFFIFKRRFGLDYSSASPRHLGTQGLENHYERKFMFNHEVVAYRQKNFYDEDYDKINSK